MKIGYLNYLLNTRDLYDDSLTSKEYLQIIDDYMISINDVVKVLNKASTRMKRNTDFNHYSYIIYGLIKSGKESSDYRKGN